MKTYDTYIHQKGVLQDRYYDEYNEFDFGIFCVMGFLVLIGICCVLMIVSIVSGFIAGRYYFDRKNWYDHHGSGYTDNDVQEDHV